MSKGYKIGEACKELDVQPYVLRYWETEFPFLRPAKGSTGPRVYDEREIGLIRRIKELLYDEGYTIAGAKKKLEAEIDSGKTSSGKSSSGKSSSGKSSSGKGEEAQEKGAGSRPASQEAKASEDEAQRSLGDEDEEPPAGEEPDAANEDEAATEAASNPAPSSLDSSSNERIETIARGLRALRDEARELLELLDRGASAPSKE